MRIDGKNPGFSFYVTGSGDEDTLIVTTTLPAPRLTVDIPIQALPWRDLRFLEKIGRRREHYGPCGQDDPLLRVKETVSEAYEVAQRTDIQGADALQLENGIATLIVGKEGRLLVPCLRLAPEARMPVAVRVTGTQVKKPAFIDVAQLAGGRRVGGVRLALGGKATKD